MDLVSQSCFSSDRDFSVFSTRSRFFMHLIAFSLAFSFLISLEDAHSIRKKQIWMKKELFWAFRDPFDLIHSSEQKKIMRSLIETAFTLWESALDGRIVFHQKELINNTVLGLKKPEGVDIDILFAKGHHGDKEDLDGRGGMVAHSGYPPSGFLHLDSDENWSMDDTTGVDLRYVILHETGHVLGLRHSRKPMSLMNPFYRGLNRGMELPQDDVRAIRTLYGLPENYIL